MLGGAGLGAACFSQSRTVLQARGAEIADPPPLRAPRRQSLALARFAPALADPDAARGPLIVNTVEGAAAHDGYVRRGEAGDAVFLDPARGRPVIPWTPLFPRNPDLLQLPAAVNRQIGCDRLLVMNESSAREPFYGNKARKYEFLLPNLHWSGVRRVATVGAVSSNHVLHFALANRLADLTGTGQPLASDLDLLLFEVPGKPNDAQRLGLLQMLAQRVALASNTFGLAGEAAYEIAAQKLSPRAEAIVPPGGSNALSVLGHMNAIADFARLLEASKAWDAPPDMIFVAMGSGSTVLGLLLGVHLLGWNTQIVGVADQDRSYLSRLVANQQPSVPFVEGNVTRLAGRAVSWLNAIGFPGAPSSVEHLLRREAFLPDSGHWTPGYGLIGAEDAAWRDELAGAGLQLDPVFTLKAWRALAAFGQSGALRDKRVLFWNTFHSYDYAASARLLLSAAEASHAL